MSYLTVITLPEAKLYLRLDDGTTIDDAQITRMINGAFRFIEEYTGIFVFARDMNFSLIDGCERIYAHPINSFVGPLPESDFQVTKKTLYSIYQKGIATIDVTLNVGHVLPADVPQDLIEVAYEIIDLMYYEPENGKSFKKDLSSLSREILNKNRRFII